MADTRAADDMLTPAYVQRTMDRNTTTIAGRFWGSQHIIVTIGERPDSSGKQMTQLEESLAEVSCFTVASYCILCREKQFGEP